MMLDTTNESDNPEGGQNCALARVILPDKATTVVQTRPGETIRSMVARLLEKRALRYTSFDVFVTNSEKPLDLGEDSTSLGCTEVRVEPRVLFRLELPSKKSIGVKAKPAKVVRDVLGPILAQYGWSLDSMLVTRDSTPAKSNIPQHKAVNMDDTVSAIHNCRLLVQFKMRSSVGAIEEINTAINSKVLEDLLRRKSHSTSKLTSNHATGSAIDDEKASLPESSGGSSNGFARNSNTNRDTRNSLSSTSISAKPSDFGLHDANKVL